MGHRNIKIKSNQIFFLSRRCKIIQYKELIQSLEQGHKGLQRAKIWFMISKQNFTEPEVAVYIVNVVYVYVGTVSDGGDGD